MDKVNRAILTSVLAIQTILTASGALKLGGSLFKGLGNIASGGGAIGKIAGVASKTIPAAAALAWMGVDAYKGWNNEELNGKDASTISKLGGSAVSLLSGSKVYKKADGTVSTGANAGMGALSGAGKGALAGLAIGGPAGALVGGIAGALVGGIAGLVKSNKAEKIAEKQLAEQKKISANTQKSASILNDINSVRFGSSAVPRSAIDAQGGSNDNSAYGMGGIENKNGVMLGDWKVTSRYGTRQKIENGKVVKGKYSMHHGIDFGRNKGKTIGAAAAGTVAFAGHHPSYGNVVYINDGNGHQYRYAHMRDTPFVKEGDQVSAGTPLGIVGSTGNSTGPHLHFEVRKGSKSISPESYVNDSIWKADGAPVGTASNNLLKDLTGVYSVNVGGQGGSSNEPVVAGLSQINQTLLDLSNKQTQQEQILNMLTGKARPNPTM